MSFSPTQTSKSGNSTPTETRLLAVTTRFAPSPGDACTILDLTTNLDPSITTRDDTAYFLYSDPADDRFTSCQPKGWADRPSSIRFSFSPAVCPNGWTWLDIRVNTIASNDNITTAFCCDAGYWLTYYRDLDRSTDHNYCESTINLDQTLTGTFSHGAGSTSTLTVGSIVHEAWQIAWRETDQTRLTPAPPSLTSGTTALARWDGTATSFGTDVAYVASTTDYSSSDNDMGITPGFLLFLQLGIPLICFFLLGCCFVCCCCCCGGSTRAENRKTRTPTVSETYALQAVGTRNSGEGNV